MIRIYELPKFKYVRFNYEMTTEYKDELLFYNHLGRGNSLHYRNKLIQLVDNIKKRKGIVHNINGKYSSDYRNSIKKLVK